MYQEKVLTSINIEQTKSWIKVIWILVTSMLRKNEINEVMIERVLSDVYNKQANTLIGPNLNVRNLPWSCRVRSLSARATSLSDIANV